MPQEFRNVALGLYLFRKRLLVATIFILAAGLLLVARLGWLQIVQHSQYFARAESNRTAIIPAVPSRGLIYDRNGVLLADNYSAYTLEIIPSNVAGSLDQFIDELSTVVEITPRDRRRFKKIYADEKTLGSIPIRTHLSDQEIARFSVQSYRFPSVTVQARLFRRYPHGTTAAHLIGYIGRVSQRDLERIEPEGRIDNYRGTEYIGKEGIERSYEILLHGQTGERRVEVSASGDPVRVLSQTAALPGKNLYLSIDIELQKKIEAAFGANKGAMVALDPRTAEVLAYVSQPSFNPNAFINGIDQQQWDELNNSPDLPLLNRPIMGLYPPGSTYKPFMAIAALDSGKRTPEQLFNDPGYFLFGNHRFRDSNPKGRGRVNLYDSIVYSSDTYYYSLANDLGVDTIYEYMRRFGFGEPTGIDLWGERGGVLPSTEWKRNNYRRPEQKKWFPGETISLGIGQGYNTFTPLQLVNALTILLNDGKVMRPKVVAQSEDPVTRQRFTIGSVAGTPIDIRKEYFNFVKQAMVGVTQEGTSATIFTDAAYLSGGKTGTAQVISIKQNEKYDERKIARKYHDHSWYIGYAPADNPVIAVAVIVENGGFGAKAAAPLARVAFDHLLAPKNKTVTASLTNGAEPPVVSSLTPTATGSVQLPAATPPATLP